MSSNVALCWIQIVDVFHIFNFPFNSKFCAIRLVEYQGRTHSVKRCIRKSFSGKIWFWRTASFWKSERCWY